MKRTMKILGGITATAALTLFAVESQAQNQNVSVDFNSSGGTDYANDFTSSIGGLAETTSGGPGSSGYISGSSGSLTTGPSSTGNAIYSLSPNDTWDFSEAGDEIQLSMMFYFVGSGSGDYFQLGIGQNNGFAMSGASGTSDAFASYRIAKSSSAAANVKGQMQYNDDSGSGPFSGAQSAAFPLVANDWYLFTFTLLNNSTGIGSANASYMMTATLYDYGTTGTGPVTGTELLAAQDGTSTGNESSGLPAMFESTYTVTGASAYALTDDSSVAAGLRWGKVSSSGISAASDFDVEYTPAPVPEPGVMTLLGLSALLGARQFRRK